MMEDKVPWKNYIGIVLVCGICLLMLVASMKYINEMDNDKDVWFHKDTNWNTCSCSTELPQYFDMCMEFINDCGQELNTDNQTKRC